MNNDEKQRSSQNGQRYERQERTKRDSHGELIKGNVPRMENPPEPPKKK
ncbi:hypothetical protein [Flavobacterium sp.]|nr:hypothetical protein [Flavobacterium sp.]